MRNNVRFITLGCRVNQYETQAMRESLAVKGITDAALKSSNSIAKQKELIKRDVNFVVINTCTVTNSADKENLYWIRRARREHPEAKIVVTGCFVEKDRERIESLKDVDLVIGNQQKADIADILTEGCGEPSFQSRYSDVSRRHEYTPLTISKTKGRGRATIKIQDGCNHACSFCKVVMVRGRSRSRELTDVVEEAKRLRDSGYKEIVFAGIQLGAYGLEKETNRAIVDVLEACHRIEGIERLRLSSIEPTDVTKPLIEALRDLPKCCNQMHIPLQSGDSGVLKGMNRRYEREFYIELIQQIREEINDFELTLDVMAGFPGEDEAAFNNTVDLLKQVKPLKCHVFPYSRREGTRAAGFQDVAEHSIRERVQILMSLAERLGIAQKSNYVGKSLPVLVEQITGKGHLLQGATTNFLKVCFQGDPEWVGKIIPVRLLNLQGNVFLGKAILER